MPEHQARLAHFYLQGFGEVLLGDLLSSSLIKTRVMASQPQEALERAE